MISKQIMPREIAIDIWIKIVQFGNFYSSSSLNERASKGRKQIISFKWTASHFLPFMIADGSARA